MTGGFALTGRRFVIPAPVVGMAVDGEREIAGLISAGAARVGDDLLSYTMGDEAADLAFANSGRAPFLLKHVRSLDCLLGALRSAWIEDGVLRFLARLAPVAEAERIWTLLSSGFPISVSLAAEIEAAEVVGPSPWGGDRVIVGQWRLVEVSACVRGKNVAAYAVPLNSAEGREILASRPHSPAIAARHRLRLDDWQQWAKPAAYRIAETLDADPLRVAELLAEEVAGHGARLLAE